MQDSRLLAQGECGDDDQREENRYVADCGAEVEEDGVSTVVPAQGPRGALRRYRRVVAVAVVVACVLQLSFWRPALLNKIAPQFAGLGGIIGAEEVTSGRKVRIQWTAHPDMCLDVEVPNQGTVNGTSLVVELCSEGPPTFHVADNGKSGPIRWTEDTTFCLLTQGSYSLHFTLCESADPQQSEFTMPAGGQGQIHVANNAARCLDVPDNLPEPGHRLQQWACTGSGALLETDTTFTIIEVDENGQDILSTSSDDEDENGQDTTTSEPSLAADSMDSGPVYAATMVLLIENIDYNKLAQDPGLEELVHEAIAKSAADALTTQGGNGAQVTYKEICMETTKSSEGDMKTDAFIKPPEGITAEELQVDVNKIADVSTPACEALVQDIARRLSEVEGLEAVTTGTPAVTSIAEGLVLQHAMDCYEDHSSVSTQSASGQSLAAHWHGGARGYLCALLASWVGITLVPGLLHDTAHRRL
jgi:hypothetical protein